jgi:hypothetical protein
MSLPNNRPTEHYADGYPDACVTAPLCTCRQDVTACFPRGFPAGALTQSAQFTFAVGGP